MEDKDLFFANVPHWLRWILALPFAILCCIIVPLVCYFANYFYYGASDSLFMRLVTMISSLAGFVYGIYYCVPKFKEIIAGVFSILFAIYFAVMITIIVSQGYFWSSYTLVYLVTGIISIVMAVYFILSHRGNEEYKDENRYEKY